MGEARKRLHRMLLVLLLIYGAASLIHFVHNAEFLADYPNLPTSWSRSGVYLAWLGMTAVGLGGWVLFLRGFILTGLLLLAGYAALGLDSLGHYLLAPISAHTPAMNASILLEVTAAAVLLAEIMRLLAVRMLKRTGAV
jgi:hypothetical protein